MVARVAISIAVDTTLRNGAGSTPMPTVSVSLLDERDRRLGDTALQEAVLPQPEFVDAGSLCGSRGAGQGLG